MHYLVSFLVLRNLFDKEDRAGCFTLIPFLVSCDCKCSVAFHHDGGISWSYSFTFCVYRVPVRESTTILFSYL